MGLACGISMIPHLQVKMDIMSRDAIDLLQKLNIKNYVVKTKIIESMHGPWYPTSTIHELTSCNCHIFFDSRWRVIHARIDPGGEIIQNVPQKREDESDFQ